MNSRSWLAPSRPSSRAPDLCGTTYYSEASAWNHPPRHSWNSTAPAEDAFRIATGQLVYWLADDYGMDERDAFLLLGQMLEARCTQFVNPLYTYVAKIARKIPAVDLGRAPQVVSG